MKSPETVRITCDGFLIGSTFSSASSRYVGIGIYVLALFLLSACAHYPVNPRLEDFDASVDGKPPTLISPERSDELLLVLTFSGGGTRAAALAYGVLEGLAEVRVPPPENLSSKDRHSLLDEVDVISAVSGGTFPAAYYGLYRERIFDDFKERFLHRDVNGGIGVRMFSPTNWFRLASAEFGRSDLAAEYYDEILFDGATFGDLYSRHGPAILIHATDIVEGTRFGFTPHRFASICSNLTAFPVSRAVAASSSFPGIFNGITLRNYGGACGYEEEEWVTQALEKKDPTSRTYHLAMDELTYADRKRKPYIHLVDGGLRDNLGLLGPVETIISYGGPRKSLEELGLHKTRRVAFIIVNAQSKKPKEWNLRENPPKMTEALGAAIVVMLNRSNFETMELLHRSIEGRFAKSEVVGEKGRPIDFYTIEIGFNAIKDDEERQRIEGLPATFNLPEESVERLCGAGRKILFESETFQNLVRDLDGKPMISASQRRR
jgi:NTE family protein